MGDANPQVASHVDTCPQCQAILEGYRQVDRLSKQCFRPKVSLTAQIQEACAREADRMAADQLLEEYFPQESASSTKHHTIWAGRFWSIAASLVVVAMLSALVTANYVNRKPRQSDLASLNEVVPMLAMKPSAPVNPSETTRLATNAQQPSYLAHEPMGRSTVANLPEQIPSATHGGFSLADSRRLQLNRTTQNAPLDDVAMVSNDGLAMKSSSGPRKLVLLPSEIEHVWLANGAIASEELIRQAQKKHPELIEEVSGPDELGIVTMRCHTNDMGVQYMVDTLFQKGEWTLLSANYPQPGRDAEVAFREQPTTYTLHILTNP